MNDFVLETILQCTKAAIHFVRVNKYRQQKFQFRSAMQAPTIAITPCITGEEERIRRRSIDTPRDTEPFPPLPFPEPYFEQTNTPWPPGRRDRSRGYFDSIPLKQNMTQQIFASDVYTHEERMTATNTPGSGLQGRKRGQTYDSIDPTQASTSSRRGWISAKCAASANGPRCNICLGVAFTVGLVLGGIVLAGLAIFVR